VAEEKNKDTNELRQSTWDRFWSGSIGSSLRTQSATWFVGVVIAILSVFSSHLTESLKLSINRADLRTKSYEEIAKDLSGYVFISGQYEENLERNLTSVDDLKSIVNEYNDTITKLNRNEFVYRFWLSRYWGKTKVAEFAEIMTTVRDLDEKVHSLNDQAEVVVSHPGTKFDQRRANEVATQMKPLRDKLRGQVSTMLEDSI
jgi:hypothetical protein